MFTKIGKLLVSRIKNSVLYEFAVGLIGLLVEPGDQIGSMGEYITALREAVQNFEAAFTKNSKQPFTVKIKEKHEERFNIYIALKRLICAAQKAVYNSALVAAADGLKKELKERGLWENKYLSYRDATKTIRHILGKFAEEPFAQWVTDLSLQAVIESLGTAQNEYESLKQKRIEDMSSDMTLIEREASKRLKAVVISTLYAVDFGAQRGNEVLINQAGEISEMVTETNALTRAAQTRDQNSERDDAVENGSDGGNTDTVAEHEPETEASEEATEGGSAIG